jgi:hypothetical protein
LWVEEGEETNIGIVTRQVSEEQLGERSAKRAIVGIARAVLVSPRRQIPSCKKKIQIFNTNTHTTQTPPLTREIRRIKPIPSHKRDRIRQNRPRHRIPTTNPTSGAQPHTLLRLQPRVQLQIIHMVIQLPRRLRHLRVRVPLFEGRERLEAQEGPELVHGADAPAARLLHAHDFDDAEDLRGAEGAVGAGGLFGGVVQDFGEVVVGEGAVGLAGEAGGWRVGLLAMRRHRDYEGIRTRQTPASAAHSAGS